MARRVLGFAGLDGRETEVEVGKQDGRHCNYHIIIIIIVLVEWLQKKAMRQNRSR